MEGDDGVRVGVKRGSMSKNVLLERPVLGKPTKPMAKEALYITHGKTSKVEEGAAACMHWSRSPEGESPAHKKSTLSAKSKKRIEGASHGMKSKKGDSAGDLFATWPEEKKVGRKAHTPVGKRTGKLAVAGASELTHGVSTIANKPGAAAAMGGWHGGSDNVGKSASALRKKKDKVPDMMFGRTSVREEGVGGLISHQYGRDWIEETTTSKPASSRRSTRGSRGSTMSEYDEEEPFPSRDPSARSVRDPSARSTRDPSARSTRDPSARTSRAASGRSTYRDIQEERSNQ